MLKLRNFLAQFIIKHLTSAFSLVETLLALMVIGVISVITIPILINSTQDLELRTAFKKEFEDLAAVNRRMVTDYGGSLKLTGIFINSDNGAWYLSKYLTDSKYCYHNAGGNCWATSNNWYDYLGNPQPIGSSCAVRQANGPFVYIAQRDDNCTLTANKYCAMLWVDVNGFKGPNRIGKDIFEVDFTENSIVPGGAPNNQYNQCGPGTNYWGCAAWIIQGKDY